MYLCIRLFPPSLPSFEDIDRQMISLRGRVKSGEYRRTKDGELRLWLTLDHIQSDDMTDAGLRQVRSVLCSFADEPATILSVPKDVSETTLSLAADVAAGETIIVRGKVYDLKPATNHGEFDARLYYETEGISFRMLSCELIGRNHRKNVLRNSLFRLKRRLSVVLDNAMNEEQASLMRAILLGEKGALFQQTRQLYQSQALSHILVVSGLHISAVGWAVHRLLRRIRCPSVISAAVSSVLVILYAMMTGFGVSAVRAVVMFLLSLLAGLLLRTYDLPTALGVCGAAFVTFQPLYLLSSGFLFSFGMVAAAGFLLPAMDGSRILKCISLPAGILPVYLRTTFTFPVYSVLLNLIIIPMTGILMLCGSAILLAGSFHPTAGCIVSIPARLILSFYDLLCRVAGELPEHNSIIGARPLWQCLIYLALLGLIVLMSDSIACPAKWYCLLMAVMLMLMRTDTGLAVHFIDVGQGDAILIQCRQSCRQDGMNILVDGGSSSLQDVGSYQLLPLLRYYGVEHIDYCIVSHEDADHMNGVLTLLENCCTHRTPADSVSGFYDLYENEYNSEIMDSGISIGCLVLPDIAGEVRGDNFRQLESVAERRRIPVRYCGADTSMRAGELAVTCLHPDGGAFYADPNDTSIVLLLTYGWFSMLLTGDLESGAAENACFARLKERTDVWTPGNRMTVLKVAHHGSGGATGDEILSYILPEAAVISCGRDNRYGHPHPQTVQKLKRAGSRILDTRKCGEITIRTDGKRVWFDTFLNQNDESDR